MNYRHIYHAGNFADVLKHAVLARLIEYLKLKDKPFRVIDTHAGIGLYVYSSGSVQAQRLVFGYTPFGDLTPLFAGYFDTRVGSKLEPASYRVIAAAVDSPPGEILFLSDAVAELDAAQAAGLRTTALDRGEAPSPEGHPHIVAKTFDEVERLSLG